MTAVMFRYNAGWGLAGYMNSPVSIEISNGRLTVDQKSYGAKGFSWSFAVPFTSTQNLDRRLMFPGDGYTLLERSAEEPLPTLEG
jgi:hypothetical protein